MNREANRSERVETGFAVRLVDWMRNWWPRRSQSRLRLCDSLPLGEKRFVAVVEFDSLQFLVAGTPSSITLLSHLPPSTASLSGVSQ